MPAYVFDYITADGLMREAFTLDDGDPVGPQVRRVLAELRERGVVLQGGPDDQLSIEWNGVRLDEHLSVETLGVTAFRPIELRMRPRHMDSIEVRPATRAGAPRARFVPLEVISAALTGALSGALAWTLLALLTVSQAPDQDRDALAALVFVGMVGFFFMLAQHGLARRIWLGLMGITVGAPMTAALSAVLTGAIAGAADQFIVNRIVMLAVVGGLGALTLALSGAAIGTALALAETFGLGVVAGTCLALLASLESLGVGAALGWPLLGAGITTAAVWPRLRRAHALCEQLPRRRTLPAALTMRSHPLVRHGSLRLVDGATVEHQGADVLCQARGGMVLQGRPVSGTAVVVNGDRMQVGGHVYRFRVVP